MYLFSEPLAEGEEKAPESLMEYVARQNGPLDDYHPQMLLQCLIWGSCSTNSMFSLLKRYPGKFELVKEIITNLCRVFLGDKTDPMSSIPHLPVGRFLEKEQQSKAVSSSVFSYLSLFHIILQMVGSKEYGLLFDSVPVSEE